MSFAALLLEMDMAVDMVDAEAMIARTLGAKAKFQFRIVGIRSAADLAFARVRLFRLLLVVFLRRFLEIYCVFLLLNSRGTEIVKQPAPAENQIVKYGDDRHKAQKSHSVDKHENDGKREKRRVDNAEPLHLNGDDEKQQYRHVRINRGEGKEHGKVNIGCGDICVKPCGKPDDRSVKDVKKHTREVIDGKLTRSPIALKRASDEVIEIKGYEEKQPSHAGVGNENKGDQAPNLTLGKYSLCTKAQKAFQKPCCIHHTKQPDNSVGYDDIEHQVLDAEFRMSQTKAVYAPHQASHKYSPLLRRYCQLYLFYDNLFIAQSLLYFCKFKYLRLKILITMKYVL